MIRPLKIAFILPWYGKDINGGAETEAKRTAENLSGRGIDVEVLTTCAKDFLSDWNTDYYPEGTEIINGITVRRFVVRKRDTVAFDRINHKLINHLPVSQDEERIFMEEMINSPALYQYIIDHRQEYDHFLFIPYMFGTTFYGSQACPEKTILIPCLHDESYAHMDIYRNMFSSAKGVLFLAEAEKQLAYRCYDLSNVKTEVTGGGVDTNFTADAARFKEKYDVRGPFILYAGRKDPGKNVDQLVDYFAKYHDSATDSLKLVLIGPGKISIPDRYKHCIIDLGFIPKQDKYDAYAAATIFCNPSANESFSIVIMESWLCGVPVLVNSSCAVTKEHCIKSNAGLYFDNFEEFGECVDILLKDQSLRARLGENGRAYVLNNYSWDIVVKKYLDFFKTLEK